MNSKKNAPCGLGPCTVEFIANGEAKKEETFCYFDSAKISSKWISETITLEPRKHLWINGRSIADLRIVYSEKDVLSVRLIGRATIPGSYLRIDERDYRNGKIIEVNSDGPICCGMTDGMTMILSVPKGYAFDSLIFTGKSIASDIPLTATYTAAFSALYDIRFNICSLNLKVKSTIGNIDGAITGIGSSHAKICADHGNVDIRLDGYDTCNTLISATTSEMLFEPSTVTYNVAKQLLGSIRANTGTVVVR